MRVLFITQYFPPEVGAAQNRLSDLAKRLASLGHGVTVLTAMPNYPRGEVFVEYRGKLVVEEQQGLLRVVRTWIYATKSKSFVCRLANYFSFVFTSFLGAITKVKPQDIVVVESPPLFLGISGVIVSWLWRSKLVFNVSDLWPKSAVDLKILNNRTLIRLSTLLEEFIYRRASLITGQTQGIISNIQQRVSTPVLLYTNGYDPEELCGRAARDQTRQEFGLTPNQFLAGFLGLHGLVYDLDSVLLAAEKLSSYPDILFVLFGDGPEKLRLQEAAKEKRLRNVRFFASQPKHRMPHIVHALDITIAALKPCDLFKGTLPAKLFESMGAGVPVVFAVEGEAKDLVERAGGGICVTPQDVDALAQAVLLLRDRPDLRQDMGRRGQQFIVANYDRRVIAERVALAFSQLLPANPAPAIRLPVEALDLAVRPAAQGVNREAHLAGRISME